MSPSYSPSASMLRLAQVRGDAAILLAERLAELATQAPGGTKWPHFELPSEHKVYKLIGFLGADRFAGGATPEEATERLASELLTLAEGASQ